MDELECMRSMDEAIQSVADESARARILGWLFAKYGIANSPNGTSSKTNSQMIGTTVAGNQIAGIAKVSADGDLQITIRDLKARSANDAALRLLHVLVWASGKLTGQQSVSSKAVIVPWLKRYRCYDGNTRGVIAQDKGILRDGDLISLDFHAEQRAEKFVEEILDPAVEGKWKPGGAKKRQANARGSQEMNRND